MKIVMIIPIFLISLATSIVVEIAKVFPVLSTSDGKRVTAFVVSILVSVLYFFSTDVSSLTLLEVTGAVLATTFVIYKALVQPVVNIVIDPIKARLATPKGIKV